MRENIVSVSFSSVASKQARRQEGERRGKKGKRRGEKRREEKESFRRGGFCFLLAEYWGGWKLI